MKKLLCALSVLVIFLALNTVSASAAVNGTVRVGLRYGSGALTSANLENTQSGGYDLGYYDGGRSFVPLGHIAQTAVTMTTGDTLGSFGETGPYGSFEEASAAAKNAAAAAAKAALKSAEGAAAKAEYDAIMAKAVDVAKKLMGKPACALASAKAAINKAAIETIAAGKAQETTEFTLLFDTHDQKEGMAAMIEKRPAVFTNN